jgi:hypothetical protein
VNHGSSGMMPRRWRPRPAPGLRCSSRACPALSGRRSGTSTPPGGAPSSTACAGNPSRLPRGIPRLAGAAKTRKAGHLITEEMLWPRGDAAMRHGATAPPDRLVPPVTAPGLRQPGSRTPCSLLADRRGPHGGAGVRAAACAATAQAALARSAVLGGGAVHRAVRATAWDRCGAQFLLPFTGPGYCVRWLMNQSRASPAAR